MKTGPQLRRRTRPSLVARWRAYWLVALVCALLGAGAVGLLVTAPAFRLAALNVTGLAHVSRAEVVQRAAIDPHANIWFLDRRGIERRIAAIPYVASAKLHRRPLGNVWLEVSERRPEACVYDAARAAFLVDGELRVLARGCAGARGGIRYTLRGALRAAPGDFLRVPELTALAGDARTLGAGGARYRAFAYDGFGQLEATLAGGIAVRFGDDADLSAKQRLVGPILAQLGARAALVRAVDLRAPGTPVVEYRSKAGPQAQPDAGPKAKS